MAEHTHTLTTHVPPGAVWEFVRDMDRWAPFMLGYQSHEKRSERESLWTLKGDVGSLTRKVDFRVQITEWTEPERVRFTLEGVGEDMQGDGSLDIAALDPNAQVADSKELAAVSAPGFLTRLWAALVRLVLGQRGAGTRRASTQPAAARLTFRMRLTPGGAMAPMLEAMIKPVMVATAEHLAERIVDHLEAAKQGGVTP